MVMAQVIENGQRLDIYFSRVVAAGSQFTPHLQQITAQTLHASVATHIKTAKKTAKRRQEAQKRKLHNIEAVQKEALAAVTKVEDKTEGVEEALRCAKERGDADTVTAENEVEECKKMQLATSAAAAKMASKAKIVKEKYQEAKATIDNLQDGRCYVSDIYRGLNSYGLFTSIGILAARGLPQRHARRKLSVSLVVHPSSRASERESGVLHDELPLPYVDCGRNALRSGLHGIACDGTFHDVHGTTIPVVVKMPHLTREVEQLNEAAEAMEHEFQVYEALDNIQGSTIPRLYGCGYIDDWYSGRSIPALILENAGGNNLTSLDVSTLTKDDQNAIYNVLCAFHKEGWVHGDISQRNILYSTDTDGRKKFRLCDLSLAERWQCEVDRRDEIIKLLDILYPCEEDEDGDDDSVWKKYRCRAWR
ncbi:hypothetical protein DFS33DRAFT_206493 [Desarmillaria ectypa]|nr:hypothetical protein DFS33DRAFT_206493 [Desarmillaria ectypa]